MIREDDHHLEEDPSRVVTTSVQRAAQWLTSQRHVEGYYEGFSDAGVAFDAANLILARFVGETWPEPLDRVSRKVLHILSGQHESGLFYLYPEGPCSIQATKIVGLALGRVLETYGEKLTPQLRQKIVHALTRARLASARPPDHFELPYMFGFRWMLEALDSNAATPKRFAPTLMLMVLLPVMCVGLIPASAWQRIDRIVYPFIAVVPQLLCACAWRAVETSTAGGAFTRWLDRSPSATQRWKTRVGTKALRWLLDRQDLTGGFYYSPLYTYLFVAAVRDALALAHTEALQEEGSAAIARALAYIRLREIEVPTGISTSFVASDVWDTTAVANALLEVPKGLISPMDSPEKLAEYALDQQSVSGGFSYGRGSHYPDVDTTGLVMGLFAAVLLRKPNATNRDALVSSLIRAFDFLELHHTREGGFNAWTVRHGTEAPLVSPNLTSLLFDVSSADVTARIMVSLARVVELAAASPVVCEELGTHRLEQAKKMRKVGLSYLLSMRNASSALWPARWSLGFIIGTRFVFDALATYPELGTEIETLRDSAARTLLQSQNPDGGFGESPASDLDSRFTPSYRSCAFMTAAAQNILAVSKKTRAQQAAARALAYVEQTQRTDGTWPEVSVCTQFSGLYTSYALMTQVAVTTTLFRAQNKADRL